MANQNGNPNSYFIAEVRRILRDQPVWYGESQPTDASTGAYAAGSKPFRLQRAPVILNSVSLTAPGGAYKPTFDQPATLSQALGFNIYDDGPGGVLPAGDYRLFWTLADGATVLASLPSVLSNQLTIGANRKIGILASNSNGIPVPLPAGGINIYIAPSFGTYTAGAAAGYGMFIPAGALPPYDLITAGNGIVPVFINSDTGEVAFGSPPGVGTMAVSYQGVRYSDTQILDALSDGLHLLWPEIWNWSTDTTSIFVSPTQYEYSLPAAFQDNRCVLRTVEFAPPSGIVRYFKTSLWHQIEDPTNPLLVFSRIPPVASTVRLGYVKPLAALSETPSIAQNLPVYYALARLCLDQETMRGRSDDISALTGEGALQPSAALNTADYWLQQFSTQLTRLGLDEPVRRSIQNRAVERLGLSEFWTDLA